MKLEFKNYAFLAALVACGWTLLISGKISLDQVQTIRFNSELAPAQTEAAPVKDPMVHFQNVIKVLNIGVPLAFACILVLVLTYKTNPIGVIPLAGLVAIFYFASSQAMRVADHVEKHTDFSINARVWWM